MAEAEEAAAEAAEFMLRENERAAALESRLREEASSILSSSGELEAGLLDASTLGLGLVKLKVAVDLDGGLKVGFG